MKWLQLAENERTLVKASGSLFIVVALVWGWVAVAPLMRAKSVTKSKRSEFRWVTQSPERIQARWQDVNRLREKMRPWVEKNRANIAKMRGGDIDAFTRVYNAIPQHPNAEIIGISSEDTYEFTWNCHAEDTYKNVPDTANAATKRRYQSSVDISKALLQDNRAKYNDIAIADATLPGKKSYVLWASGRITEVYSIADCRAIGCFANRTHHEVSPAL